jgi:hypothetical protein
VRSIIHDPHEEKETGVRVIDMHLKNTTEYYSRVIIVNASTLNALIIPLNSVSDRFPNGFGNDSGQLGEYVAFHNYRGGFGGNFEGYLGSYYYGRRPTMLVMPNFRNIYTQETYFSRGYLVRRYTECAKGTQNLEFIGKQDKEALNEPGPRRISMRMQVKPYRF